MIKDIVYFGNSSIIEDDDVPSIFHPEHINHLLFSHAHDQMIFSRNICIQSMYHILLYPWEHITMT
jgi:hypothetical protein